VRQQARVGISTVVCCAGVIASFLLISGTALADDPPPTDPPPAETTPEPPAPPVPTGPRTVVAGVTIAGQDVGGLTTKQAVAAVSRRFDRSQQLVISKTWKQRFLPWQLGAHARVGKAVEAAMRARSAGAAIPLTVDIDAARLRGLLARLGKETARKPVDSKLHLVHLVPTGTPSVAGRRLQEIVAFYELSLALRKHAREPLQLPFEVIQPAVTDENFGKAIVIRRGSNQLYFYNGPTLKRVFRVATGQSSYPSPLGRFEIIVKQRNPWWYPPQTSAWAKGKEPVPPGPGNPLGTRWMGLSAPLVGIHGTPDAASIGYSASHGCIRMLIPQVEWLFEHVEVGTPVFIVSA
jgi:L,D-transpeptidase catalytic domain/Putative peptidoglycan binding domain